MGRCKICQLYQSVSGMLPRVYVYFPRVYLYDTQGVCACYQGFGPVSAIHCGSVYVWLHAGSSHSPVIHFLSPPQLWAKTLQFPVGSNTVYFVWHVYTSRSNNRKEFLSQIKRGHQLCYNILTVSRLSRTPI